MSLILLYYIFQTKTPASPDLDLRQAMAHLQQIYVFFYVKHSNPWQIETDNLEKTWWLNIFVNCFRTDNIKGLPL